MQVVSIESSVTAISHKPASGPNPCAPEPSKERDFSEFFRHIRRSEAHSPLIFNCQLGGGRTTTGVVIACLVRRYLQDSGQLPPPAGTEDDTAGAAATTPRPWNLEL